ncbi:MAG: hypothetical protein ACPMAQ_00540 [Phycisphaerae bacterium]
MASSKHTGRDRRTDRAPRWELSPNTRKALLIGTAGLVVVVLGVWAFQVLVAPAKPDLKVATVKQVCEYLGHPRGFASLPVDRREEFLADVVRTYSAPERFEDMSRALAQMSFIERQQLVDAVFEIGKDKFVKASQEYVRTPKKDRPAFVDKVIRDMESFRAGLVGTPTAGARSAHGGGGGAGPQAGPVNSLANVFKDHVPTKSDAWAKMLVDRTSPSERQQAKPLADDLAQRLDQLHSDPRAKAEFARGR